MRVDGKLFREAMGKFFAGLIVMLLLLFLPAGSLRYWNGWLLTALLFGPMFVAGIVMLLRSPELLRRRLNAKEEQAAQKKVVGLSALMFAAAFVAAGLNWRFRWVAMPDWAVWAAAIAFLLAYALYAEVLRENTWLSRTIEVQEHQKVIDTGLYGVVRHPMYAATLLLFLSMPLVLGSPPSFAITLAYIPIIAARIRNEEAVLEAGLEGYADYKRRVKYRVIPHIW